jgi:hypothetical protein
MSTLIVGFLGGLGGICTLISKLHVITESRVYKISILNYTNLTNLGGWGELNHDYVIYVIDSSKRGEGVWP